MFVSLQVLPRAQVKPPEKGASASDSADVCEVSGNASPEDKMEESENDDVPVIESVTGSTEVPPENRKEEAETTGEAANHISDDQNDDKDSEKVVELFISL